MSNVQDNAAHTCSYSCDRPECIKAQRDELAAAAAQEAVAKVGSDHFRSIVDWLGPIPPPNTLLYAAPVSAAPPDLIERCREILAWQRTGVLPGDALRAYANARWPDEHDPLQIAEKETAREAFRILARAAAASTPAAPGIGLYAKMIRLAEKWEKIADEHGVREFTGNDHRLFANELRVQIDASPKGALNEQFGSAEGFGGSEGGSDVIERIAALLYQEATDEPWTVAGVEHEIPDRAYYRELARRVLDVAQAGDAEVQP